MQDTSDEWPERVRESLNGGGSAIPSCEDYARLIVMAVKRSCSNFGCRADPSSAPR